jgi:CRP/FNR family transcriptional regulator, cyclic AMP receptor protein
VNAKQILAATPPVQETSATPNDPHSEREVSMTAENDLVITVKEQKHPPGGRGSRSPGSLTKETTTLRMPVPAFHPRLLLQKLGTAKTAQEYQADESVFSQGDAADAVFYIESGKVKLTVVSKRGKEAVIAILPEKSFFGEGCLAGQPIRMSTASVLQRSMIVRVEKSVMLGVLHREPEFAEGFLGYLLARNIRMEADLVDHLFNSSEKRLARLLLLLANFGQEGKPIPLIAKMSQETLAEMIGTTRSRVSFFMNRFRDLGFIDYNSGGLHVHSSLVSVVLHD